MRRPLRSSTWQLIAIAGLAAYIVVLVFVDIGLPWVVGVCISLAITALFVAVVSDEYRSARGEGQDRFRSGRRALRRTVDMFVMGK